MCFVSYTPEAMFAALLNDELPLTARTVRLLREARDACVVDV
jgi:hypothetical protein